jgi:hypothetical protein
MLTTEDRDVLGIAPETLRPRRSTAVSQILRAVSDEIEGGGGEWPFPGEDGAAGYRMVVASDRKARQAAYSLAHRIYQRCGYADEKSEMIVSAHDANPESITLLARDEAGNDAATISLVFDSPAGLPCDEIYGPEVNALRARGRRLVEVTRLAIDEPYKRSKALLVKLFNFVYIFARRVKGYDDFVIEVLPRHASYYQRLLSFELAGPERPCPRVQNSPSLLLRLDFAVADEAIRRTSGKGFAAGSRTLYPHFYSWLEEGAVAELLAKSHKPMSLKEIEFFGLSRKQSA